MSTPRMQWSVYALEGFEGRGVDPTSVLVVSRESANEALPIVTVVPLTDLSPGRRVYPNEALLPPGAAQLSRPAVAMAHQIQTVAKTRLSAAKGSIDEPLLRLAVSDALRVQLNLEPSFDEGR